MNRVPLFCLAFSLLMASIASGQSVDCEFSDGADFSHFKTYKWVTFKNVAPIDDVTDEQIKAAVDTALAKKGLTKVDGDTADLFIGYQTNELIDEKFAKLPTWDVSPQTIYQGELGIDMYTPANRNLVWRGVASGTLHPKAKPEKRQKYLNKAVAKMMNNYPPSGKNACRLVSPN